MRLLPVPTGEGPRRPQGGGAPAAVVKTRDRWVAPPAGWREAPWGGGPDAIAARLDRPAPGAGLPPPPSAVLTDVVARLEGLGFESSHVRSKVSSAADEPAGGPGGSHGPAHDTYVESRPHGPWVTPW